MLSLKQLAIALGGDVTGRKVLCPGPHHSRADRSLQVTLDLQMPDGFAVHSYAGDDFRDCRDHVRQMLGLPPFEPGKGQKNYRSSEIIPARPARKTKDNSDLAMNIWCEAVNPAGTLVETYLRGRKLELPPAAGDVIRFSKRCKFRDERHPAMIALVRDVRTNEPTGGIHRTALRPDGTAVKKDGKTLRKALGPITGGCIKLDDDADIEIRLTIGEGIETCLSARKFGYRPVWSAINAGMLEKFPVLPIIETIFIIREHDETSAQTVKACARNWFEAGREVIIVESDIGNDLNDELLREAC